MCDKLLWWSALYPGTSASRMRKPELCIKPFYSPKSHLHNMAPC